MFKIIRKSLLAAADIALVVMLILCAVFYWQVAGYILLAIAAVQYIAQTVVFVMRSGLIGLASPIALVVLGIGVAFPVIIVGLGMTIVESVFILGALAALLSSAYTFADLG